MDDLVQFLREQLDEDEREAQEALKQTTTTRRRVGGQWVEDVVQPPEWRRSVWGPSRVLAEIDAKRQLLDDYTVTARIRDEAAARIKAAGNHPDAKDLETWDRAQREAAILEGSVKLAASPLADRTGYCEEWRP